MVDVVALSDPAGLDAIARDHDALLAVADGSAHEAVLDALIARLHGRRPSFFWAAATAVRRRRGLASMQERLRRVVAAPDRDTPVGRRRLEAAARCFESEAAMQPLLRELVAAERVPAVAIELLWSLVHGAPSQSATAAAIVDVVRRLGAHDRLRKEAARALSYCDARARASAIEELLSATPPTERRALSSFARLLPRTTGG